MALPLAPRSVVDPHDPERSFGLVPELLDPPQERVRTGCDRQAHRQPGTVLTADGAAGLSEPIDGAGGGDGETRQVPGEEPARARRPGASEAVHYDVTFYYDSSKLNI